MRRLLLAVIVALVAGFLLPSPASAATSRPVYPHDFPDPFVLTTPSTYYAYATQTGRTNVQLLTSTDLRTWRRLPDALPTLPRWAAPGRTWAPAVWQRGGRYVLYYTTRHAASGRQCISVAVAATPRGPFVDRSAGPLVCQLPLGGSIDPAPFADRGGTPYLLWKSDANAVGRRTQLWSQPLTADGLRLTGKPVALLTDGARWEAGVIEAPDLVRTDAGLLLFYSGGRYDSAGYAVGYARCTGVQGPCTKVTTRAPWLRSRAGVAGPGGQCVFRNRGGAWRIAYHGWPPDRVGYPRGGARMLWIDPLSLVGGRPRLG